MRTLENRSRLHAGAVALVFALILPAAACGDDDDDTVTADAAPAADAPPAQAATVVFEPPTPGAGADWATMPFPSDLYLDGDGFLNLTSLPSRENADMEFSALLLNSLRELDGAGVQTNVYFPIDGDLDPATLAGNVKLVDLEDSLAEIDADLLWRADLEAIVLAPKPGTVLLQQHDYAAYVTSGVEDTNGNSLEANEAFQAAADLDNPPSDAALLAAQESLTPLLEALPSATASSVVAATVFRTATVGTDTVAMRDIVAATPPVVTITQVQTDPTVFMGVQDPDAPPGFSILGIRHQPSSHIAAIIHGTITLANFTNDDPLVPGYIEYDMAGLPIVKSTNAIPFTLVLPHGASYADMPVMIFQHGINTTRVRTLIVGDVAAAHGLVTLGIDLPYHGSRAVDAKDDVSLITGENSPDGFGDPVGLLAAGRFFHLLAAGEVPAYDPLIMKENLRRSAIDISSLVSFVKGGDPTPINVALDAAGLPNDSSFHTDSVGLFARSFGALVAGVTLAVEPDITVAAFDVPAAGFPFPSVLHSAQFSPTFGGVIFSPLDVNAEVVLGDDEMDARFHPASVLWAYALMDGDGLNYAPYLLTGELRDDSKPSVAFTICYGDEWVPNLATAQYAAAIGMPSVAVDLETPWPDPALPWVTIPQAAPPLTGNIGSNQTAGMVLVRPCTHGLATWYEDTYFYEPDMPPFVELDEPVDINNYTLEVQNMFASFFVDGLTGMGAPTIADTFMSAH